MIADVFQKAQADAQKAVSVFLPSLAQKVPNGTKMAQSVPPPTPSRPPRGMEGLRALSLARHVEKMSARVARGLPPEEPKPNLYQQFGPELDPVHIRALSAAIASHPETQRANLLHEAHESLVKWIASHNGKVVIDGHMELAHSPQTAETLAAKIINGAVDEHDQREQAKRQRLLEPEKNAAAPRPETRDAGDSRPSRGVASAESTTPDNRFERTQIAANPGQGNRTQTPEIVPPGDGKPPAQGAPPQVKPEEAAKVGTRKRDGHQVTQPKNSVAANQKLALDAAPQLDQLLGQLTSQVPGASYERIRPQKASGRLDQKVRDDNQPNTLSDYLGAQIAADTPQAKDQLIALLKKNFNVIEVDDQFLTGRQDKAGYPSANVQVQMGNGMTAEVQIVPTEVQKRTEESHQFYKAGREAEESGDTKERDRQWDQAKEIHNQALEAFKTRNGISDQASAAAPSTQDSSLAGYEVLGDPIQLGSHTFVRVRPAGSTPANPSSDSNAPQNQE